MNWREMQKPRMLKQNMPHPTSDTPKLWADPRMKVCKSHDVMLYPDQICSLCYQENNPGMEIDTELAEPLWE